MLPGSSDTHVAEFFPGFVTEASDFGREWAVHHYGLAGHMADKAADDAGVGELLADPEIPRMPSGELVAPLLDSLLTGVPRPLPGQPARTPARSPNVDAGVVVECIGVVDGGEVRPRDRVTVPSIMGEHLRRVVAAEELTVEAALTGDPTVVLAAMLADPLAGRLPYEHVVAMTGELLAATAEWLPQFKSGLSI